MTRHIDAEELKTQLEFAAFRDRDLDAEVATDWFTLDTEAWHTLDIEESKNNLPGTC